MAFTRSSGRKLRLISAMDAGPVAAPSTPAMVRITMRAETLQAAADSAVNTRKAPNPMRYTRRWP